MQPKWKKIALLTAPILIGGTVYALAADGTPAKPVASASETSSNISYQVVKSEPLTSDEMQQLEQAKLTPQATAAGTAADSSLDPMNPFVVHDGSTTAASSAAVPAADSGTTTAAASSGASSNASATQAASAGSNDQFDLNNVKNFSWKTMTSQGELKIDFKNEDGKLKLDGDLAGRKIELEGAQAVQLINQLLQRSSLNTALTATLQGKPVSLDSSVLQSIEDLKVEMQDGRHIEAKPPGNGNSPKAQGKHDNGLHKGPEKAKEEHGKGKKGKED